MTNPVWQRNTLRNAVSLVLFIALITALCVETQMLVTLYQKVINYEELCVEYEEVTEILSK